MTITEALRITQSVPRDARPFAVTLACGFTPLHLQTFLAAHLQQALTDRKVIITPGLYGNLVGTLESISGAALPDGLVIALEWPDLDPRLDYRGAGSWGATAANDIVAGARTMLDRIAAALLQDPARRRASRSHCLRFLCRRCFTRRDGRLRNMSWRSRPMSCTSPPTSQKKDAPPSSTRSGSPNTRLRPGDSISRAIFIPACHTPSSILTDWRRSWRWL